MRNAWLLVVLAVGVASGQEERERIGPQGLHAELVDALKAGHAVAAEWKARCERVGPEAGALWGLPGVCVLVGETSAELSAAGLTSASIREVVESRLRAGKVTLLTKEQASSHRAAPTVRADVSGAHERGRFTVIAEVRCTQSMLGRRPHPVPENPLLKGAVPKECPDLVMPDVPTWQRIGLLRDVEQRKVIEEIAARVDAFCADYHRANAP